MEVECCALLVAAVAVTLTVNCCGVSEALLPPQAAGNIETARSSTKTHQFLRCCLRDATTSATPSIDNGMENEHIAPACPSPKAAGIRLLERAGADTLSVADPPAATDAGEIPQVGIGAGPLTEQLRFRLPVNPPCVANVKVSFTEPPRLNMRLVVLGVTEKSCTVTVRLELLSEVSGSGEFDVTLTTLVIVPPLLGVAAKLTVALADAASVPKEQLIAPFDGAAHVPWLACTDATFAPCGVVSLKTTLFASVGPLFFTVKE